MFLDFPEAQSVSNELDFHDLFSPVTFPFTQLIDMNRAKLSS